MKDTLYLPLKAKWYEMIESGVKTEEYREIKPYWIKRFCHLWDMCGNGGGHCSDCFKNPIVKPKPYVQFSYGYTKRTMAFEVKSICTGYGKPEWGAPKDRDVFIIALGRKLK